MAGIERYLSRLTARVENRVDLAIGRFRGARNAKQIAAYRGFGNASEVFVWGRVLANMAPAVSLETDSWWRNLQNTYRRLESDELPGIVVRASLAGAHRDAVTDQEGFFRAWLQLPTPMLPRFWHEGVMRIESDGVRIEQPFHVITPTSKTRFGIISDLDDTVVHTRATSPVHMARQILFGNARTRLPFHGVAAFYRALHGDLSGAAVNPIFYVSSSPWNIYDLLTEFLELQRIPLGPLMLRDWGITEQEILPTRHQSHKRAAIRQIMDMYPDLPFILIGDSGQQDPEIYRDVVRDQGERVLAVYIRNVTPNPMRRKSIEDLANEVTKAGSILLLADDTLACAQHAASKGWIPVESLAEIAQEEKQDETILSPKAETVIVDGS
ncbi:MAG: phosphatase domain-containing protein [Longimicrobiales bacterium]